MQKELVASAHDCSDGGLAVAISECCFGSDSGARIDVSPIMSDCNQIEPWGAMFGESLGRILVSVKPENSEAFENSMTDHACYFLGVVEEGDTISVTNGDTTLISTAYEKRGKQPSMEVAHSDTSTRRCPFWLWDQL
jgi:phosphoribosylformylglycinamidine synthase